MLFFMAILALAIALQVADVITTNAVIRTGGVELNPVVKFFMDVAGKQWWTIKIPVVAPLLLLGVFVHSDGVVSLAALAPVLAINVAYTYVVINNYRSIR